jgi:hypothetical protein
MPDKHANVHVDFSDYTSTERAVYVSAMTATLGTATNGSPPNN